MNEFDKQFEPKTNIEISVKKQQEKKYEYIDSLIPHAGHKVWEINNETLEIKEAEYAQVTYVFGGENKPEIIIKKDHSYVCALNKRNALRKYKQGRNGSKDVLKQPYKFFNE